MLNRLAADEFTRLTQDVPCNVMLQFGNGLAQLPVQWLCSNLLKILKMKIMKAVTNRVK
jgi:hypothetical protein